LLEVRNCNPMNHQAGCVCGDCVTPILESAHLALMDQIDEIIATEVDELFAIPVTVCCPTCGNPLD
jgi:hypothetical protein